MTTPAALTASASPALGGAAGAVNGDLPGVGVEVRRYAAGTGELLHARTVARSGAAWADTVPGPLAPGAYSVHATQADTSGNTTTTPWRGFTIVAAEFTISPEQVLAGSAVTFTALTRGVRYAWDLDDDGAFDDGSARQVSRVVTSAAPQRVRLRIIAPDGTADVAARWITPGNRAPSAGFEISPAAPVVGQTVTFTSTASDPDGLSLASEAWDLDGDGDFDDATGGLVRIAVLESGTHRIGLRVIDQAGAAREATQYVVVAAPRSPDPTPSDGSGSGKPPFSPSTGVTGAAALRPALLSPFPIVRIAAEVRRRGVRVRTLSVNGPKGAQIRARCAGRGCPGRIRALRATRIGAVRIRRLEGRFLRAGAIIEVFVTARGRIGKYTRFVIRGGKSPKRSDRCLAVDGRSPIACPTG